MHGVAAKNQCHAEHGNGDRSVFRRRKAQKRAPILLLKSIECGENGAEHRDDDDKNADTGGDTGVLVWRPFQKATAQAVERGVEHHARHQCGGRAAARAVRGRKPLAEWEQPELGAEPNDEQNGDGGEYRRSKRAGDSAERRNVKGVRRNGEQQNRDDQRDRAEFEQAEHK